MSALSSISNLGLGNKTIKGLVRISIPAIFNACILAGTLFVVVMIFYFTGLYFQRGLESTPHVTPFWALVGGYGFSLGITSFEVMCWQSALNAGGFIKALFKEPIIMIMFLGVWIGDALCSLGGWTCFRVGHYLPDTLTMPHPDMLWKFGAFFTVIFSAGSIWIIASIMDKVKKENGGGRSGIHRNVSAMND